MAAAADAVCPAGDGLAVLIYHRVGGRTSVSVDLPTDRFTEQLAHLGEHYLPVPLAEAAAALEVGLRPPGRPPIVVTFDDGTADFVDEALPLLVDHDVPVTLYVATEFVERRVPFPDGGTPVSWAGLADAVSTGLVTIGSHTHTHRLLDRAEPSIVADELDRSIDLIGDRLGLPVDHFAYPKAVIGSPAAEAAVRARFVTAALAGSRLNRWADTELHRLARIPIQTTDGMRWFRHKAASGLRLEDELRVRLNRRRHAGAIT